jgi:putative toxin-antitoxin system antitoxin component (TIGR02293 family)
MKVAEAVTALEEWGSSYSAEQHSYVTLLGLRSFDPLRLVKRLEEGLSYAAFEKLRHNLGLSARELAELASISPRTLSRRKDKRRFLSDESDRLVRIARILGLAIDLFEGDLDGARRWLAIQRSALDGATALEMVRTEVGAREVEALIGRLEHGVFT